jgi:hypothetical protein
MKQTPYILLILAALGGMVFISLYSYRHAASPIPPTPSPIPSLQAITPAATQSVSSAYPDDVSHLAWFYKPPQESDFDFVADHFDFFILTHKDETARDQFRQAGLDGRFSQYLLLLIAEDPDGCDEGPRGNQVAFKEGDFCMIRDQHPDWFLQDQNGQPIKSGSDTYHMDPGSEGYRQFFLEQARELQETHGWDDLFLDNVEASPAKMVRNGTSLLKYPDAQSYADAVEGFLAYLRQGYFEPRGKKIYGNIVSLDEGHVFDQYLQHLDGAMVESFATYWSDGFRDADDWEEQMTRVQNAITQGKTMILVAQGTQGDVALQKFTYASYLLLADGNAAFRYTHSENYRDLWWYDNYELDLGQPLDARYEQDGGWRRDFANGYVTVNPHSHVAEIVVNP